MFKPFANATLFFLLLLAGGALQAAPGIERENQVIRSDITLNASTPDTRSVVNKVTPRSYLGAHEEAWIHESALQLSADNDFDGYYTTLSLWLDLDTVFNQHNIVVDIFLQSTNGYTDLIFSSNAITLFSDSSRDAINLQVDLDQGVPGDHYDLIIDIYDADSLALITTYDRHHISDFNALNLESYNYDVEAKYVDGNTTYHVSAGGSGDFPLLILFCILVLLKGRLHP